MNKLLICPTDRGACDIARNFIDFIKTKGETEEMSKEETSEEEG